MHGCLEKMHIKILIVIRMWECFDLFLCISNHGEVGKRSPAEVRRLRATLKPQSEKQSWYQNSEISFYCTAQKISDSELDALKHMQ